VRQIEAMYRIYVPCTLWSFEVKGVEREANLSGATRLHSLCSIYVLGQAG